MEVTKKKEREEQGQEGKKPGIDPAIIEELMKDYQRPEDLTGAGGILEELHKRLYERVLGAELTHYLGYAKGEAPQQEAGQRRENHRNGSSKKTLISEEGKLEIEVARDRSGEFEPQFIRKGQKRFGGFDTKIPPRRIRAGHDGTRDQALLGGAIQGGSIHRSDQHGD
jgi:putative transposase